MRVTMAEPDDRPEVRAIRLSAGGSGEGRRRLVVSIEEPADIARRPVRLGQEVHEARADVEVDVLEAEGPIRRWRIQEDRYSQQVSGIIRQLGGQG